MRSRDEALGAMLEEIPPGMDTRPSSPIYNGLAPAATEMTQMRIEMETDRIQSDPTTATEENLRAWCAGFAFYPKAASSAQLTLRTLDRGGVGLDVSVGDSFMAQNTPAPEDEPLTYTVTTVLGSGLSVVRAGKPGAAGGSYLGPVLPLQVMNALDSAQLTDVRVPGENDEDDDVFRARFFVYMAQKAFAGNIAAWRQWFLEQDGVGAVNVIPVPNGGGTVSAYVLGGDLLPVSAPFVAQLQDAADPAAHAGLGVGMAPIGARMTVATPAAHPVIVAATVSLQGVTLGQVQAAVNANIEAYFAGVRAQWMRQQGVSSLADTVAVYRSQVAAAIMGTQGVVNVDLNGLLLSGAAADVQMTIGRCPVLGEVVLTT